ncbi:MAG: carboxypeptidase-like regulatory domain-containing protein, partial [Prolixibacteraceae bacterium]
MKRAISIILLVLMLLPATAQRKKRGKVKRKYRNVEQVNQKLPQVYFRGIVRDADKNPLPGAAVTVQGSRIGAHTNAEGEFFLTNIPTGKLRIEVSYMGFETKTIDYIAGAGQNYHNITLDLPRIHLNPVSVTSQNREQQLPDVPIAVNTIKSGFLLENNITELSRLAEHVPGLYIFEQGAVQTTFV